MKPRTLSIIIALLFSALFSIAVQGQAIGTVASAVWLSDCNQSDYFNTSGSGASLIGPAGNLFANTNLGVYTHNSGTLILRGGEVRTFKTVGSSTVCSARMYYRVYLQSGVPGAFNIIDFPFVDDCDVPSSQFPSGGSCAAGDQKWNRIIADGTIIPYPPVNLTSFAPGNYVLEVYYDIAGSSTTINQCNEITVLNNGGSNYKAFFSIQSPDLASNNPTTCGGTEGYITISGLVAGATYAVSYTDDGVPVGPLNIAASGAGQIILSGLNAGVYSDFQLLINGCSTDLFTGIILSNPVFTPTFTKIPPFCAGSIQPVLPLVSNNGISGTWSPSVVNNQASGSYTFTPTTGQCGLPSVMNVTVTPRVTPTFSFGTVLAVCQGGTVPPLPNTSSNGIAGSWSPATVSNQNSAVYTFTPNPGQCVTNATFTVTIRPNIVPTFDFGTTLTVCAGGIVPTLPATSVDGITGTWSPATVSNQNSAVYTFTPLAILCAVPTTFTVTVNPNITPTFSFGTSLSICSNAAAPLLITTSTEGITGTWNPAVVDNHNPATYTFTPDAGLCAVPATFTVFINPNITPSFIFGTALTICAGGAVPALPGSSLNGITGTWNPGVVDDQNTAAYIFTPDAGLCALPTTFVVTVNPNLTPSFSFGTSLTICAGGTVPALPVTSDNGITGTWNTATADNQNSAVYTFTPDAGLCALPAAFAVTVNPNVTPTFSFGTTLTVCATGAIPALPGTSGNGITGTWNPAIIDNSNSGTYTFTPDAGLCAIPATLAVTVVQNIIPAFSFGTSLTICAGVTVPSLTSTSTNGIPGTWAPSSVNPTNSGVYIFTPDAGFCAIPTTFTVTINPNVTPVFSFGLFLTICSNDIVPVLNNTSTNGVTGTWSPAIVDNKNGATYTFTPNAGVCASPTTFTVIVNPKITPSFNFGTTLTICAGGTVPALTTTSLNGITGTWNPAVVSNQASAAYTFTGDAGFCALPATFVVTVNPNITPSFNFGTLLTICAGGTVPALPTSSTNGITGTWSPAVADNQNSGTYTFTPDAGLCALPATFTITVNPNIVPTFSFGTTLTICAGNTVPALTTTSTEGITGTWNPAVASNQASGVYTFTPAAGQCAVPTTFTVTVTANITPAFNFGTSLTICAGGAIPVLSTVSTNGITGTWNPAVVNDQASGIYTFTPGAGLCALPVTFTVTVNPNITPTFSFGTSLSACTGAVVPALPTSSVNGITGSWNPVVIDNQNSGTYTFIPDAGLCAISTVLTVTINPILTPVFDFGTTVTICSGTAAPVLPVMSTNGITGTWDPAVVDNQANGIYTFTPTAGQCATPTTLTVTVTPTVTPVFSFGGSLIVCTGGIVPPLPTTSTNGIDGVWNPAVVSNQANGVYTFTPTAPPDQCIATVTFTVTVKPILTPAFSFGTTLTICAGGTVPQLPVTSTNSISGVWNPTTVSNQSSGVYTFTSDPGQCAAATATFTVTVNPLPTLDPIGSDTLVFDEAIVPANIFSGTPADVSFNWVNTNPAIGLAASGNGNIPSFTATNKTNDPITSNITVTPVLDGCPGSPRTYIVTVNPLNKDVFVPNVFSPNSDGKNDILFVYGNYINKLDMRIFNQWGEQIIMITDKTRGWDGTHRGKAQPVGVYVYVLQAELVGGRKVKMKGSITLLR
ncbi:MAG: gliding motility-associated C-terminal domain-containing protein [Chitinophagaceae bacterium]